MDGNHGTSESVDHDAMVETPRHNGQGTTPPTPGVDGQATIHTGVYARAVEEAGRRYPGFELTKIVAVSRLILLGHELWRVADRGDLRAMIHPANREGAGEKTMVVKVDSWAVEATLDVGDELWPSAPNRRALAASQLLRLGIQASADVPAADPPFAIPGPDGVA